MSDNKLEKHFKEKIDGHISPIDPDALWDDIQKKRPNNEAFGMKRIILSLLVGLLLIGGICCYVSHSKKNAKTKPSPSANLNLNPITNSDQNSTSDTKNSNPESTNSKNDKETNLENNINQTSKIAKTNDKVRLENQKSISNSTNTTKDAYKTTTKEIHDKSDLFNMQNKSDSNIIQRVDVKLKTNKTEFNNTNSTTKNLNQKASGVEKNILPLTENSGEIDNKIDPNLIAERSAWLTDKIALLDLSLLHFDIGQPSLKETLSVQMKRKRKFEIGAFFNYEYAFRNLTSTASDSSELGPAFAELRDDSEKFIESYRTGIFLRYNFKNKFRASIGLEYAQLTERFESMILLDSGFRNDNSTNFMPVSFESFRVRTIHNRYTNINIPVNIGKSFGNQRLSYFIDMGAFLNISLKSSGQIFTDTETNSEFSNLEDLADIEGTDLVHISYTIHTGLSYQLDDKTKIELGPQFHSSFNPEFRVNSIETKRYYLGMRINVVRNF